MEFLRCWFVKNPQSLTFSFKENLKIQKTVMRFRNNLRAVSRVRLNDYFSVTKRKLRLKKGRSSLKSTKLWRWVWVFSSSLLRIKHASDIFKNSIRFWYEIILSQFLNISREIASTSNYCWVTWTIPQSVHWWLSY